jgi:hypothetical protein
MIDPLEAQGRIEWFEDLLYSIEVDDLESAKKAINAQIKLLERYARTNRRPDLLPKEPQP